MQIENNDGVPITSVAAWRRLAPPASAHHWREYRSACELAHAWIEGDADASLRDLLALALLNVHPPGCACGCGSKGDRSFVLNRPGEHVSNVWGNDLDAIVRQARDVAVQTMRGLAECAMG